MGVPFHILMTVAVHSPGKIFKVRELSGNFDISQGILHFQPQFNEESENFGRQD